MTSNEESERSPRKSGASAAAKPPSSPQHCASTTSLSERAIACPQPVVVRWALASCAVMILGSLGPWATATVLGISVSVSGLHGGGWVTLLTAILGAIVLLDPGWTVRLAWPHRHRHAIWLVALGISAIVCLLNLFSVENYRLAGIVQPGWGLYVTLIATLGALATDWAMRPHTRRALLGRPR